jgi:hypothetical protein
MLDEFISALEKEIANQSKLLHDYLFGNAVERPNYSRVSLQQEFIYGLGKALILAQEIRNKESVAAVTPRNDAGKK